MHATLPPRTLVLLRHAKAEQDGPTDLERRLAERGHRDAAAAGAALAAAGIVPDAALVSSATRTRETWDAVAGAAGWDVAPQVERAVYDAWDDTLLDLVRLTDAEVRTLVVVGHNPTMASLAQLLGDDGDGTDRGAAAELVARGLPTCGYAVFSVDVDWADLVLDGATLTAYGVGRAD